MKNIHVLPTNKPSRLCFRNYLFINKDNIGTYSNVEFKNIYITSDEEIKEKDWCYYLNNLGGGNILCQAYKHSEDKRMLFDNGTYNREIGEGITPLIGECKKIILTTDPDLIKDGVQAIDDEFLEWFVKNLSCEEVGIQKQYQYHSSKEFYIDADYVDCTKEQYESIKKEIPTCPLRILYKIIIPKEEPKQETLEEAAEKYADFSNDYVPLAFGSKFNETTKRDFIEGAKWQAERSYSDEEVESIWKFALYSAEQHDKFGAKNKSDFIKEDVKEFIKQFKKK